MDPDVARARMLELANVVLHTEEAGEHQRAADLLAEAVHDMDEWLRSNGFLPTLWMPNGPHRGRHIELDPLPQCEFTRDEGSIRAIADGQEVMLPVVSVCTLPAGHSGDHLFGDFDDDPNQNGES